MYADKRSLASRLGMCYSHLPRPHRLAENAPSAYALATSNGEEGVLLHKHWDLCGGEPTRTTNCHSAHRIRIYQNKYILTRIGGRHLQYNMIWASTFAIPDLFCLAQRQSRGPLAYQVAAWGNLSRICHTTVCFVRHHPS